MAFLARQALVWATALAGAPLVAAIGTGDANTIFNSYNNALLVRSGSDVFYKASLSNNNADPSWSGSLNILVAEDAYEQTGDADKKTLVNDLLNTWLRKNAPPWTWNWWNDDLGWYTMALARGYLITGNTAFLTNAKYGFDLAFSRGWDTQYNGGGIWEENPEGTANENPPREATKEALANDSLGKVACLLYQATHDTGYLDKCRQIFDWVRTHLYDANTGQIWTGIDQRGGVNTAAAAYNQGTFLEFATILYEVTGDAAVRDIAQKAIDYARNSLTVNGIFSNSASYLNTWADEVARGVGRYVQNHQQWDTYYAWMVQNADAIMTNRRSDLGITSNAWDQPTPLDNTYSANKFASATAWLQYTPASKPDEIAGLHYIINQKTGLAIDNEGTFGNGKRVIQWGMNWGQNQRWQFSKNSDGSWNIISLASFEALDCPAGTAQDGLGIIQWQRSRDSNQRWWIERQSDGAYQIRNQASGKSLDSASNSTNGATLIQWGWNGQSQQRWILQPV
ncbi:glycoside hydrolase family 76 protein [Thozetella sp. PMI_491]|nr:glycoside hydrolase family 76 protein [Thozetella sp. PMI_491]